MSAGVVCLALGAVSGAALVFGIGVLTAPAMILIAVTTAGFLAAGAVLIARARPHRAERSAAGEWSPPPLSDDHTDQRRKAIHD